MLRRSSLALAFTSAFLMAGSAIAAEPIVGKWKTQAGANATIASCGSSFCIKLTSGEHSGKQIGKVKGSGKNYKGKITDPAKNKTYTGKAGCYRQQNENERLCTWRANLPKPNLDTQISSPSRLIA